MNIVESLVEKTDTLTRSEIWAAGLLIFQAVLFLFFTESAFNGTAFGVMVPVGILSACVLLEYIFTKKIFKKENLKTVVMALLFGIAALVVMGNPKNLSFIFHYGVSILIIVDGFFGILSMMHFRKIQDKVTELKLMSTRKKDQSAAKEYDNAVLTGLSDQREYMLKSLRLLKNRMKPAGIFAAVVNVFAIVMGIVLILLPDSLGLLLRQISGVCLFIIGTKDMILAIRAGKLKRLFLTLFVPGHLGKAAPEQQEDEESA